MSMTMSITMMSISHSQDRSRLRRGVERDDRGRDTLFFFRMKTIGKLAKSKEKPSFLAKHDGLLEILS